MRTFVDEEATIFRSRVRTLGRSPTPRENFAISGAVRWRSGPVRPVRLASQVKSTFDRLPYEVLVCKLDLTSVRTARALRSHCAGAVRFVGMVCYVGLVWGSGGPS